MYIMIMKNLPNFANIRFGSRTYKFNWLLWNPAKIFEWISNTRTTLDSKTITFELQLWSSRVNCIKLLSKVLMKMSNSFPSALTILTLCNIRSEGRRDYREIFTREREKNHSSDRNGMIKYEERKGIKEKWK